MMNVGLKTAVTELLGIEYPIIQGCMQWIARAPLAGAVSAAGGLGMLSSSTFRDKDALRAEIRAVKAITDKPFAVNLTLMPSLVAPDYMGYIQVCIEEGVRIIETAGRPPKDDMVSAIKGEGITLIHKCTTVKHALKAQSIGADMVVADGCECAGHPGENDITTMVLTPACVKALDIPVIAAGGIGTGRQMAAALMLGAGGRLSGNALPRIGRVPGAAFGKGFPGRKGNGDGHLHPAQELQELHEDVQQHRGQARPSRGKGGLRVCPGAERRRRLDRLQDVL